jgi:hypothetical protein
MKINAKLTYWYSNSLAIMVLPTAVCNFMYLQLCVPTEKIGGLHTKMCTFVGNRAILITETNFQASRGL